MILRTAATLAALLVAAPAFAQNATSMVKIADSVTVAPFSLTVDQVDDMDVHDAAGKKIGEVEDVLGQTADAPAALTVDFDDDAGYGDRDDVIVPIGMFSMAGNRLVLSAAPETVAAMPVWND